MSKECVIGIDIGTTSVKACLFTLNGKVMADVEQMIQSSYPKTGWAEQDVVEIEQSAIQAVRAVIEESEVGKEDLLAVGFSAAMHSLLCVDESGRPLSPALIWSDSRGSSQAEKISQTTGSQIYAKTGTPIHPMTPFIKLLWMNETSYEPYQNAAYFMSIKEFLLYRWFNQRVIDYSMASATGLFNPERREWETELLDLTGIKREQLSELMPPTTLLNTLNQDVAEKMGVDPDLPFVIGAADGQLANLGSGAISPGEVAVSVGTSGAIRQFTKGVKIDPNEETFSYLFTKETSIIGGPTNNGGIVLQWLKDLINYQGSFDAFLAEAEHVTPGAEGLFFLPYINGERAPLWNAQAKGNFYGLTITHKKEHLIRAVLEGITLNLYQIGKALERMAGPSKKLVVNGGLAQSRLWMQLMADVFDSEITVSESVHSAAWGAAWTALIGIGKVDNFETIKDNIPMGESIFPNQENRDRYREIYKKYNELVIDIEKHF